MLRELYYVNFCISGRFDLKYVVPQLQQEKDARYWGVDTNAIHHAMHENDVAFKRIEV